MIPAIGCLVLLALVCAAFDITVVIVVLLMMVVTLIGVLIGVLLPLVVFFALPILAILGVGWLILKALS